MRKYCISEVWNGREGMKHEQWNGEDGDKEYPEMVQSCVENVRGQNGKESILE